MSDPQPSIPVRDLGRMRYADAYAEQSRVHEEVLAWREARGTASAGSVAFPSGVILQVEHDPPVITVSRREGSRKNLVASVAELAVAGIEVAETDRGGDITYHGPGQLVVYPIIDLNAFRLGLHDYMRLLEDAVIEALAEFGITGRRDSAATGVWVNPAGDSPAGGGLAKVCAMGVRVRRWVSLHGLALNISTNLEHFQLIVPCGLAGRPVTSTDALLPPGKRPGMEEAKKCVAAALTRRLLDRAGR